MAGLDFCLANAVKAKKISQGVADRLINDSKELGDDAAIARYVSELSEQKSRKLHEGISVVRAFEMVSSHEKGMAVGISSMLTSDVTGKARYANVDYTANGLKGVYHAELADMLSRFRTRTLGLTQDTEGLDQFVRAMFGQVNDIDGDIIKFADDFDALNSRMVSDMRNAGGIMGKLERYLPNNHNARVMRKVGKEAWVEAIKPKMDLDKMSKALDKPVTQKGLDEILDYAFDSITTNGLNKTPFLSSGEKGKKISQKYDTRRVLHFKDADSWLDYHKEFGANDIFSTIMDHVDTMAHDTALIGIMGPDPRATFNALISEAKKKNPGAYKFQEDLFKVATGEINNTVWPNVADIMSATRNNLSSAYLGGAFISALSDTAFTGITSKTNNIKFLNVMQKQLKLLNPANEADRIAAVKIGLGAEAWTSRNLASNRYADVYGVGKSAKVSEAVMRGSFLSPWTDAGRKAFGMEFTSMLADNFGKSFDELDPKLIGVIERYDIGAEDWNSFRKTPVLRHKHAKYANLNHDQAAKFRSMVLTETDYAVPTPNMRTDAIKTMGTQRGSIEGEILRSLMTFKSFPITMISTHLMRAAYANGMSSKMAYMGALMASTTIMGGIALQAKDIARGREPRPVFEDPQKFLGAAITQGGGLGILGDFLFSDVNRFGGGLTSTLAGPVAGLAFEKIPEITLGNLQEAIKGEETHMFSESIDFAKEFAPDVWQIQLLKDSMFDQLSMMADDDANARFSRKIKKRYRDYGQGYWWAPGETTPNF